MRLEQHQGESAKERALRIPLDYVHGTDPVQRWKLVLTGIVAIITAGYGIWLMLGSHGGVAFSHGPLARAHAAWDADCSACHVDYVPLREDAAQPLVRLGLVANDQAARRTVTSHAQSDRKCETCHAGPPHHHNELEADVKSCVHCHTDHRGRHEEIARPTDRHCTRCHENISAHRRDDVSIANHPIESVSHFTSDPSASGSAYHPDFRSLKSDPGNVKFNHAMHMTAGIPAPDKQGQGIKLMKWSDLRDGYSQQYRRYIESQGEQSLVQLDCSSCHRTDEFQSAGAYFLPVKYADDCRACHPLNYEANGSEMPHGLTSQAMSTFLAGRYLLDQKSSDSASPLIRRRPIPGRSPEEFDEPNDQASAKLKVAAAEQYLVGNKVCDKCHTYAAAENSANQSLLRDVERANIPRVWLKHARFDHKAHPPHRVQCVVCHQQTDPDNVVGSPWKSADRVQPLGPHDQDIVMIAGRVTCLECHAERSAEKPQGGARFDCVECHRYHSAGHQ